MTTTFVMRARQTASPDLPEARYNGLHPGRTILRAGGRHARGALPLPCDIVLERDVPVPMRDGAILRADVYRPTGELPVPGI